MADKVTMPALGESVTEGTVTRWLKNVGDRVEVDEPLVEVSTDKVDTEIPSPVAGTLQEIYAQEDDVVAVGGDLALIGEGAAPAAPQEAPAPAETATESPEQPQEATSEAAPAPAEPAEQAPAEQAPEEPAPAPAAPAPSAEPTAPSGGSASGGETVSMPALGESVTEGTVTRWLKNVGDDVAVDEPLLEVSTDKVDTEIPSPVAGTLTQILVGEDDVVPVGAPLAVIGGSASASQQASTPDEPQTDVPPAEGGTDPVPALVPDEVGGSPATPEPEPETAPATPVQEAAPVAPAPAPAAAPAATPAPAPASAPSPAAAGGSDENRYVTPLVRKLAAEHGVDLAQVTGTGIGGRIRKQDVLDAAGGGAPAPTFTAPVPQAPAPVAPATPAPAPQAPAAAAPAAPAAAPAPAASSAARPGSATPGEMRGTRQKMTRLRKVIAERMVSSLQTSAQLTTVIEVDLTKVAHLRDKAKDEFLRREGVKLSYLPFLALAAVEALKVHPNVNASVEGDEIIYHGQEHLGMAVDTDRGLLVPVIRDAGSLNIAGLARKIADVAERTRNNQVSPDELSGATFTLTNTGSRGALFDTPIINQPNVAILGTGAIVKRPVVITDDMGAEQIAVRSVIMLALSYDHRIVDGADAARFLSTMKERLEDGNFEV